ncbi:MAG: DUF2249 domain-containing protein [Emcibacter sp.]|nr:DUF2249 domain-containing protein [Emcibacter sp.]
MSKIPHWVMNCKDDHCIKLDVRPVLAEGNDPLVQIMAKVEALAEDDILRIEAPFDPLPLRRMMASRGYNCHVIEKASNHWQVYFKKQESPTLPLLPNITDLPPFPLYWQDGILEMDLRQLSPPNPMIAILKIIESGDIRGHFVVKLSRDPIYLYPELVTRKWHAEIIEQNEGGILVKIIQEKENGKDVGK